MKTITLIFLMCCCLTSFAQDKTILEQIDKKCTQLGSNIKSFQAKTVDDYKGTTVGDVTGYYKGGRLQMVVAQYPGKEDKAQTEYYFDNSELIFVYKEDTFYSGSLEGKYEMEVLYFHNKKLIKWIDKDEQQVVPGSAPFLKADMEEQKEVQRLIKLLK